tara:strand:- start:786 stop:2348 length:1563 start_codon:yes stop_codon:yes gene_type:complete
MLALMPLVAHAITVRISDGHVLNSIPVGFASFTLDFHPGSQGAVWGKNASILEVDLTNKALIGIASALAPGVLRLGGSEAGQNLTYVGFPGVDTPCPSGYYYCLTRERWDQILAFASATGVRLMLDLNLIGPAQSDDWDAAATQIDALLSYTSGKGVTPWAFELGNENQDLLKPEEAAARFGRVHDSLARLWPDSSARPLLVGPSVHIQPDWIVSFLSALSPRRPLPLDVFAYHMYSGYGKAPHIAAQVPTTAFLDDARALVDTAASAVRWSQAGAAVASLPLMVSETAAAWASGGPSGACVAFASSFWYLDHLAHAAATPGGGHLAVARQTLIGGNYSLVDSNGDFTANPDYFVALLWRRVVEGGGGDDGVMMVEQQEASNAAAAAAAAGRVRVLRAARPPVIAEDTHRELRSFAACDLSGRLVVALANLGTAAASVVVQLSSGAVVTEQRRGREEWVLTGDGDDLLTRQVLLNGAPIASSGGDVPPTPPRRSNSTDPIVAPPHSIVFARFEQVPAACA